MRLVDPATGEDVDQGDDGELLVRGPHVMLEAYSHEVSSCGYWPDGAAEGLLLDKVNPRWRSRYFKDKFNLGRYFPG